MDSLANLPGHQQQEFLRFFFMYRYATLNLKAIYLNSRFVEEQQVKDSLKMYNRLVTICFDKCVSVLLFFIIH